MAVTSPPSPTYYWLTINSTVTMGGSGSLTLNNCSLPSPTPTSWGLSHLLCLRLAAAIVKPDGIVLSPGKTLTQNVAIEVVDTKYSGAFVPTKSTSQVPSILKTLYPNSLQL
jgi:hypothetical protein